MTQEATMFIQVITGKTSDREGLLRQAHRWQDELRPRAAGFLGSSSGVTDDGRFVLLARFESEDAARRNSARDEQGEWWTDTEKYLEGVTFQDSVDVITLLGGGSNAAGFLQVMRGRVTDSEKIAGVASRIPEVEAALREHRPDVIGEVIVTHADASFTEVVYFASEAAARQGESTEAPPEVQALYMELMSAIAIDEYLDLKDPWLS
jgi:hypothetical protein